MSRYNVIYPVKAWGQYSSTHNLSQAGTDANLSPATFRIEYFSGAPSTPTTLLFGRGVVHLKIASQTGHIGSNGRTFRSRCGLPVHGEYQGRGSWRSMLKDISIISVPVTDLNRSRDFYHEVLGFVLMVDLPFDLNRRWIQLAPGKESKVSITLVSWYEKMKPGSLQGLVLETDDIYSFFSRLQERGVPISPVYDTPWGKFSDFKDPDGNGWMLHQQ